MTSPSGGPQPRPGILDIDAYVPGSSSIGDGRKAIKLSANETPLGPSPHAIAAFQACAASLSHYPDGAATELRRAIADAYGLNADAIVCGAGSDELLGLLAQSYLGPGDEAIITAHGFLVYRIVTLSSGAIPVVAPERGLTADVDEILRRVSDRTRMVFLANPNNPTGTYVPIDEVRRLRAGLPDHVLLVLDAAYSEYVRRNDYEAGIELVATTTNTVMTRTFSKLHGLAALRLGWAYCPLRVAEVLNRVRGPFNVNQPAIAAGIAAIRDTSHQNAAVRHNDEWLPWLSTRLAEIGIATTPSVANFVLARFSGGAPAAERADKFLREHAIIVRAMKAYGLPDSLRITIGTAEENRAVVDVLSAFQQKDAA